jgi:hypothetical protein
VSEIEDFTVMDILSEGSQLNGITQSHHVQDDAQQPHPFVALCARQPKPYTRIACIFSLPALDTCAIEKSFAS